MLFFENNFLKQLAKQFFYFVTKKQFLKTAPNKPVDSLDHQVVQQIQEEGGGGKNLGTAENKRKERDSRKRVEKVLFFPCLVETEKKRGKKLDKKTPWTENGQKSRKWHVKVKINY